MSAGLLMTLIEGANVFNASHLHALLPPALAGQCPAGMGTNMSGMSGGGSGGGGGAGMHTRNGDGRGVEGPSSGGGVAQPPSLVGGSGAGVGALLTALEPLSLWAVLLSASVLLLGTLAWFRNVLLGRLRPAASPPLILQRRPPMPSAKKVSPVSILAAVKSAAP